MSYGRKVIFEVLREVAFGSITGSYATLGSALGDYARLVCFTNSTNVDIYISDDGVNNKLRIPANGFLLIDVTANEVNQDQGYFIGLHTQFYLKQTEQGAPGSGRVWLEVMAANTTV